MPETVRDRSAYEASDNRVRGGLYRAVTRILEAHPDYSDAQIAAAVCVGRDDRDVITDARAALAGSERRARKAAKS